MNQQGELENFVVVFRRNHAVYVDRLSNWKTKKHDSEFFSIKKKILTRHVRKSKSYQWLQVVGLVLIREEIAVKSVPRNVFDGTYQDRFIKWFRLTSNPNRFLKKETASMFVTHTKDCLTSVSDCKFSSEASDAGSLFIVFWIMSVIPDSFSIYSGLKFTSFLNFRNKHGFPVE